MERYQRFGLQFSHKSPCLLGCHEVEILFRKFSKLVCYQSELHKKKEECKIKKLTNKRKVKRSKFQFHLINIIFAGEERLSG
jgi:hypothetical protein